MYRPTKRMALAVACMVFAAAALADITDRTVVLRANTAINLASGAMVDSGGDLQWTGSALVPQGNAKAYVVGNQRDVDLDLSNEQTLKSLLAFAVNTPIPVRQLTVGELLAVETNSGHAATVMVTAIAGGSVTLRLTSPGISTAAGPSAPTITAVLNNSSRIPAGYPNFGIAPSSLFVIQGTGLADPGDPVLQDSTRGLQTTLNGASISVTVNGKTTTPAIYYTSPTQIAAVLPASTPVGAGTIKVTYKGTASAAFPIQVVASALGFTTYNGSALATDAVTGALLSYTQSGKPGEIIILWSTGLGADPADSDTTYTSSPHSVNVNLQVFIGAIKANVVYQGASVYPGVSVIGVTIPQNVETGCYVSLAALIDNVVSNVTTLPTASDGGVCHDSFSGLDGRQITQTGSLTTYKTGSLSVFQINGTSKGNPITTRGAKAALVQVSTTFAPAAPAPGGCLLSAASGEISVTGLNSGTVTVTPPDGIPVTLTAVAEGEYSTILQTVVPGGTYKFQSSGGTQVQAFQATVTVPSPAINWTNQSAAATVNRASGLQVNWSGGMPGTFVNITGFSSDGNVAAGFSCLAPVEAGQFTVPAYILLGVPAGSGNVVLINNSPPAGFSANGIDSGTAVGTINVNVTATYN